MRQIMVKNLVCGCYDIMRLLQCGQVALTTIGKGCGAGVGGVYDFHFDGMVKVVPDLVTVSGIIEF